MVGALSVAHASAPKADKLVIGDLEKAEAYLYNAMSEVQKMRDRLPQCVDAMAAEKFEATLQIEDAYLRDYAMSVLRRGGSFVQAQTVELDCFFAIAALSI